MTIAEKYAQQYQPNGEVSLAEIIQAALDEQVETHALELRAYEATVANLNERIRQMEAERVPEWKPIETAPKDGTHILIKSPTMPPTTVHWFDNGWHLSVNQRGEYSSYIWCGPNYWMPLDSMLAAAPQPKESAK